MFRRFKIRIVAIVMTVSVALLVGMLCIIFSVSYKDMYQSNQEMLEHYINDYENIMRKWKQDFNKNNMEFDRNGKEHPNPMFELSTFYSVKYNEAGDIIEINNNGGTIYSEEEVTKLAEEILAENKDAGIYDSFSYAVKKNQDSTMVVFIDRTIENRNFSVLIKYTFVFAGITLVIIFCLSCFLADRMVKPLEENDRKQKQFISDAGHELKTPIAVVSTNLELLRRQNANNKWLNNIEYETEKMSALIKQLMELAKTESMLPKMEEVDFSHLVEGEILVFEEVAFEQGIMIDYDKVEPDIHIKGNAEQLKQLVAILIDNAIEHSSEKSDLKIELGINKNKAVLTVANRGNEIPKEIREHLFERFYRSDYSRSGENNHYGLGLAIAKATAETHKGSIKADYKDGYVIFEVQIPIK